jgi:hypothetical protein
LEAGCPKFLYPLIEIRIFYRTHRTRDWDNAFAAAKLILDGLKGHAFVDDDITHIRLGLSIYVDPRDPRVEVKLQEQNWRKDGTER